MPDTQIEIRELPARIEEVIALVRAGAEFVLTEGNVPRAKLVPVPQPTGKPRVAGLHPGSITTTDDFDDPLPDEFWLGGDP